MHFLTVLITIASAIAAPLQLSSLITLRTTESQPSAGGNRVLYKALVLEEWSSSYSLLQNWSVPCSLPDIASETLREGLLRSQYPFGDSIWFLCRDVPVGSNLSYTPAPVLIMKLQEDGNLIQWASDTSYAPGTSANLVYTWFDQAVGQVFYTLGGFSPPGSTGQVRLAQPRLRIDSGPGTPPDVTGALANIATNVNPTGLSIMTDTVYIPALIPNGTSPAFFSIYGIVPENVLPTSVRSIVTYAVFNQPLMLSVWTFPYIDVIWYTGFNRVPYLARTNFTVEDPSKMTLVFPLPPSGSSGSLGGPSWRVNTARFEGNYQETGETLYLNNGTTILKNNVIGLAQGLPYQPVVQAPTGWRIMDIHARVVLLPTPSATATATATATSSASSSASSSATATTTPTASQTASPSATSSTGPSLSASASASPSSSSTTTATPSHNPQTSAGSSSSGTPSPSLTPSTTPSNGTIPLPPDANQAQSTLTVGEQAGIGLGSVATFCIIGIALVHFHPTLKRLYTRQFGSSFKGVKKGVSFRSPVSTDVPITISHNPHVLVQQRLEQLKDLQKQLSSKEISQAPQKVSNDRLKKEFQPTVSGSSV